MKKAIICIFAAYIFAVCAQAANVEVKLDSSNGSSSFVVKNSSLTRLASFDSAGKVALGIDNVATGAYSTAIGHSNTASGNSSTAMGAYNTASQFYSVALGDTNQAIGFDSTAFGAGNIASGSGATAFGGSTQANANYSVAMGYNVISSADASLAVGENFILPTTAPYSLGIGFNASPGGQPSILLSPIGNSYIKLDSSNGSSGLKILNSSSTTVASIDSRGVIYSGPARVFAWGNDNLFAGTTAGNFTMSGNYNSAFGKSALNKNTTGAENSAFGYYALYNNLSGWYNTALGSSSLRSNTTGTANTAIGELALFGNTSGGGNIAIGYQALTNNSTGDSNVAIGNYALSTNQIGGNNTAFGSEALRFNTVSNNTAVGSDALRVNSTGISNTAVGYSALYSNGTAYGNVAVGDNALHANSDTNALYNTAVGHSSLAGNTTGYRNTAIGNFSLISNTDGYGNTAVGNSAGAYGTSNTTENYNTYLGFRTGLNAAGYSNSTAIGYNARIGKSNAIILGDSTNTSLTVGIGTNAPQFRLHVLGAGTTTALMVDGSTSSVGIGTTNPNTYQLRVDCTGSNSTAIRGASDASNYGYIGAATGVGVFGTGTSWAGYFSGKLKTTDTGGTNHVYDIGELIPCGSGVENADVVIVNPLKYREAIKCASDNDPKVIGIISDSPQFSIGDMDQANKKNPGKNFRFIALAGQVQCKVSTKNGMINPGDLLTTSDIPGHAMKATGAGSIVAKALQKFDGSKGNTGKILAFVSVGFSNNDPQTAKASQSEIQELKSRLKAVEEKLAK